MTTDGNAANQIIDAYLAWKDARKRCDEIMLQAERQLDLEKSLYMDNVCLYVERVLKAIPETEYRYQVMHAVGIKGLSSTDQCRDFHVRQDSITIIMRHYNGEGQYLYCRFKGHPLSILTNVDQAVNETLARIKDAERKIVKEIEDMEREKELKLLAALKSKYENVS